MKTGYLKSEKAAEEKHNEGMRLWRNAVNENLTEENNQLRARIFELERLLSLQESGAWNTVSNETIECLSYGYTLHVTSSGGGFVLYEDDTPVIPFVFPDNIRLRKQV